MGTAALTVWRFTDGRRGHDAQSRGLTDALAQLHPCSVHDVPAPAFVQSCGDLLLRRFSSGKDLPDPDLLIGAGHATHLPLLAARRARGGRIVILMSPSLPSACFDLCLIPGHDSPPARANIIRTHGPLNTIQVDGRQRRGPTLILIGGESKHFHWQTGPLLADLRAVLAASREPVLISDSPRTPADTRAELRQLAPEQTRYVPWESAGPEWLAQQLQDAAVAWVSGDSLSMIYEALTAGCTVGVLELPPRGESRVTRAVRSLADENMINSFSAWRAGTALQPPPRKLDEAARCAALILNWLPPRMTSS